MLTVRDFYCKWVQSGRHDWQVFHDASVFEAFIFSRPAGGVLLRFQYGGELYDEQEYPTRADANQRECCAS
jgi:hypothetical protein